MDTNFLDIISTVFKYITANNLEIVAVLFLVGLFIKNKTSINDALIIFILFALSLILMVLRSWGNPIDPYTFITQSIYVTGASIFMNESPKQFKKLFGNTITNSNTTP